jgi:hypothetical protein
MNLGALIALLKLAQDAEITRKGSAQIYKEIYGKETALERAEEGGLGL